MIKANVYKMYIHLNKELNHSGSMYITIYICAHTYTRIHIYLNKD